MRRKVCDGKRRTVFLAVDVRQRAGHQCGSPLRPHHRVEVPELIPVLHPDLKLIEAQPFLRLGNGATTDPIND